MSRAGHKFVIFAAVLLAAAVYSASAVPLLRGRILVEPADPPAAKKKSSSRFHSASVLWDEARMAALIRHDKDLFGTKRKRILDRLEKEIDSLGEKGEIGRWGARFLRSSFADLFEDAERKDNAAKNGENPVRLNRNEMEFLIEGFRHLKFTETRDPWLLKMLDARISRYFSAVKGLPAEEKFKAAGMPKKEYSANVKRLMEVRREYVSTLGISGVDVKEKPDVGKVRSVPGDIKVKPSKGRETALQPGREIKWDDVVTNASGEEAKIVLTDRTFIIIRPEDVLMGWQLDARVPENLAEEIGKLIRELGSTDYHARSKATEDLIEIGSPAVPALKKALNSDDVEIQLRAKRILKKIQSTKKD